VAATADSVFIVFSGEPPSAGTVQQLIRVFERETRVSIGATTIRAIGGGIGSTEPSRDLALAIAARLQDEGELPPGSLERIVTQRVTVDGVRYVVAAVGGEAGTRPSGVQTIPRRFQNRRLSYRIRAKRNGRRLTWRWWSRPVAWVTALRHRDLRLAVATHPVYRLRAGIDRGTVIDRLGPPPKSTTSEEVLSGKIVVGQVPEGEEYWLYDNVPPGHESRLVITRGQLTSVEIHPGPAAPDPKRVTHIDVTGVHTRRR